MPPFPDPRGSGRRPRGRPPTRIELKQLTRDQLMEAALVLAEDGRGFTSLSLREISRQAGVVPGAFYRHFRNPDQLGLALVEQGGMTLRRLLREIRLENVPLDTLLPRSLVVFFDYLQDNRRLFRFITSERNGGAPAIREAIRREERAFAQEMAQDLIRLRAFPELDGHQIEQVSALLVMAALTASGHWLDIPDDDPDSRRVLRADLLCQVRLVLAGARAWKHAGSERPGFPPR